MIIPIKCFTCGTVLGNKYRYYLSEVRKIKLARKMEVDKVVYQEVPKEVVRKEVIHVPIYTNDPDLIKFGTTKIKDIMDDE